MVAIGAEITEHVLVAAVDDLGFGPIEGRVLLADLNEPQQPLVNARRHRLGFTALFGTLPVERGTVQPAGITELVRIALVGIVIEHAYLVAEVDQRYAANGEDDAVDEQDTLDGEFDRARVIFRQHDAFGMHMPRLPDANDLLANRFVHSLLALVGAVAGAITVVPDVFSNRSPGDPD